jgi:hypothetical protein
MTSRTLSVPFLNEAPIYDDLLQETNVLSNSWQTWFNSITQTTGYIITHDRFTPVSPPTPIPDDDGDEVVLLSATQLTEAQRDRLENARNGIILYNTTTNRFNFRENGAWVTFTPVAA